MIRRSAHAAVLAAALGLAACSGAGGPQNDERAGQLAPFSGMAVVPPSGDADPDQLLGLSGDDIAARLGKPALIRRDGDAEVWQYRRMRCVLDLFLYGSSKQVEHVDLRDRGDATDEAVQACFRRMLESAPESI